MASVMDKAIIEHLKATGQYREFLVDFEAQKSAKREDFISKTFTVVSLGTELTGISVALTYQAYKAVPASISNDWTKAVSRECLEIMKSEGVPANWEGVYFAVKGEKPLA